MSTNGKQLTQPIESDCETWKKEAQQDRKAGHIQWYEAANRLGKVVEYIIAPLIPSIAEEYFGYTEPSQDFSILRKVCYGKQPNKLREFDIIAVYPNAVILNETKETVRQSYLENFVAFVESGEFYSYFPQYKGRKLIPIFSSLYLAEPAVNYLTKHGIYALAMGDETMTLLNFEQLKGQETV